MAEWTDIDGWLTTAEGRMLQMLAAGQTVLELGSYLGRSTVCMALVAFHVTSVDAHQGDANTGPADTFPGFRANLERFGVTGKVEVIRSRFEDAALVQAADLVFVDGQHDADSVARDTRIAAQAVKPGGTIAWHDWTYESVRRGARWAGIETIDGQIDSLAWKVMP